MNFKSNKTKTVFYVIAMIVPVAIALYFAVISPYLMDDWAWATSTGQHRLETFFENYNGRYLGNLYIIALSRCNFLWYVSLPVAVFLLSFFVWKFTKSKNIIFYLIPSAMFGIMSREMFRQIIIWRSGFSNYVPPILAILLYLVLIRNIFEENAPEYKKRVAVVAFCIALIGSLFMENLTLYSIGADILILIYTKIRFRKVYSVHISHLAGAVIGAVIMFSNSAYLNIVKGNDAMNYRSFGEESLLENIRKCCEWLFENSSRLFVIMLIVMTVLLIMNIKKRNIGKTKAAACIACLAYAWVYSVCMVAALDFIYQENFVARILRIISATVFFICIVTVTVLLPIEKTDKIKIVFILFSAVAMAAPMLVISPISPRCFFASFIMETIALCLFVKNLLSSTGKRVYFTALTVTVAIMIAGNAFYGVKFYSVHEYHQTREDFIQAQLENNCETIQIPKIPDNLYPFSRAGDYEPGTSWEKRFCEFYGIDLNEKEVIQCSWSEADFDSVIK